MAAAVLGHILESAHHGGAQFLHFLRTHSNDPIVQTLATPWRWTIHSSFYAAVTDKHAHQLFPPHRVIGDLLFVVPTTASLIILYGMFIWPYPRSSRVKQVIAFFLLLVQLGMPLLFTCPTVLIHYVTTVTAVATATRMIDLYYVQPWTKVAGRYHLTLKAAQAATARSKKTDSPSPTRTSRATTALRTDQTNTMARSNTDQDEFFKWDMDRFQLEMWSPMRKPTGKKPLPSIGYSWKDLLPSFLVCYTVFDAIIYYMSFYTAPEMLAAPTLEYGFLVFVVCAYVIYNIQTAVYVNAIAYSAWTGLRADPAEWTMLETKMPLFAYSPADFWVNWQTLFRYIWVDLGFNPVQRFCKKHLGPERLGRRGAQWAREILPVYAVFFLSAVMHAYIVYTLWREPVWSQMAYFLIQATGVVITKAIERTPVGKLIQQEYNHGSPVKQRAMRGVGILMMVFYHLVTAPFFIHPYQKQGMWNDVRDMSALVRAFRK
ncbi:hypothetical protein BGZ95_003931 [Linnemannia exigua]|uniref:Wax synthase domain-containing protein n=1 Tax=Linnemannia exigua TaxID=604196 RepID=A0AAD4DJX9_9FUNG|nr:hypothetical protein BGZ95_003931 [Linnemannia exigua]